MNIYTLTLNPAYDIHAKADRFLLAHENLAEISTREAGGKGVNLSRALTAHGIPNTAIVVLGKENGAEFKENLEDAGIRGVFLERKGRIRENLTVHCADGTETRISFRGFSVDNSLLEEVASCMDANGETIVTFTGSVPAGISRDGVLCFLRQLRDRGAKLVLDSKSLTLEDLYDLQPWLIKPNQEEISAYFDRPVETIDEALACAQAFVAHGIANVMISLGAQGAVLVNGGKTYIATPPKIKAVSTIGAGDSSLAGFIAAATAEKSAPECLRAAVSYGTAACLTEGSRPPKPEDTAAIFPQVRIQTLAP